MYRQGYGTAYGRFVRNSNRRSHLQSAAAGGLGAAAAPLVGPILGPRLPSIRPRTVVHGRPLAFLGLQSYY